MRREMKYNPHYYQLREEQLERMLEITQNNKTAEEGGVVFFGDSITQMYDLDTYYPELSCKYNSGISGATSQELLWMVDEGVLKFKPRLVVLMIGINDLGNTIMSSPKEIAFNVKNIIDLIRGNLPETEVLLLSTLPCVEELRRYDLVRGIQKNDLVDYIYDQYQELILDPKTQMLRTYDHFMKDGEVIRDYYVDDLHLNDKGYEKLTELIKPYVLAYFQ